MRRDYQDIFWDDLRIPGSATQTGASAPDLELFGPSGTLRVLTFAGTGATVEQTFFQIQIPHSYLIGSTIAPHVHWSPTNANAGTVVWQLEYSWASIDGTFGAPTTIEAIDPSDGVAWKHQVAPFSAIIGTGKGISSMLVCRLFRNPGHASDNYESDAAFLEFDFHIQSEPGGSRLEYVK